MKNGLLALFTLLVAVSAAQAQPVMDCYRDSVNIRYGVIMPRADSYADYLPEVTWIQSAAELDSFLTMPASKKVFQPAKGRNSPWNQHLGRIADALSKIDLRLDKEDLVIIRHIENSGSNRVHFDTPVIDGDTLRCSFTSKIPIWQTWDMAYSLYVVAVKKSMVKGVRVENHAIREEWKK